MASESSSNSKNAEDSYIGNFISLISKYDIRYEGVLYYLNVQDSAIGLKNVRSYGTEGRKKDGPQVPPSDKVYEYILFRGSDIKDLQVKSYPPVQIDEQLHNDPAIIQSQLAGVPCSPSLSPTIGGRTSIESTQWQDTPALASRVYPSTLPTHQFASQVDPANSSNHSQAAQNVGPPLFSTPLYFHGYRGTSINVSQAQQNQIPFQSPSMLSSPLMVQCHVNTPDLHSSPIMGLINAPEPVNPVLSSITSSSLHSTVTGSFTPVHYSMSPDMPSCSSIKAPASQAAYASLTMSSFPSSFEDTNINESQPVGKLVRSPAAADPSSVLPTRMPYPACSSGSLQASPPSLLTPGQLAQTRPNVLSSIQSTYPGHKDTTTFASLSSYTPTVNSTLLTQPPLLPLPTPAQQSLYSTTQFTEEFDFEAMNEKFKKDEVWGYLGKAHQKDKAEGIKDDVSDQSLVDKQGLSLLSKLDPKPAYTKDCFFDTISCNSQSRVAKNAHNRFSERMKLDSETFGNFQQRSHVSYGSFSGYVSGRGQNYRGSYNWGREYGHGGRGHGNMYL
ncbi:decapping 5-like protein [Durio zibethinus]|uniref:Decapping 5-like protein n=1 Tax=Durio zibethinus TaxID=66656 RepID=A0A6P5YCC3_DURZI|nr:decapping 5-like protein [Durio zibethinus]